MPEQVRCPSCSAALRVPDTLLGKKVKCPKCQTAFTAEAEAPLEPEEGIAHEPAPSAGPRRRPAPPPEEDLEEEAPPPEEEFEDEDRPQRRGRRRGRRSAEAASAVAGPAISLMVVGGIDVALNILFILLRLLGIGVIAAQGPAGSAGGADSALTMVGGIFSNIFALVWASLIILGAVKMKGLSSYGLAMTACVLGIVPCHVCCFLGIPFGIWGLVVLNKPEVKESFS